MPKKVITRRQRKAAEAKRKAEEDAARTQVISEGGSGETVLPHPQITVEIKLPGDSKCIVPPSSTASKLSLIRKTTMTLISRPEMKTSTTKVLKKSDAKDQKTPNEPEKKRSFIKELMEKSERGTYRKSAVEKLEDQKPPSEAVKKRSLTKEVEKSSNATYKKIAGGNLKEQKPPNEHEKKMSIIRELVEMAGKGTYRKSAVEKIDHEPVKKRSLTRVVKRSAKATYKNTAGECPEEQNPPNGPEKKRSIIKELVEMSWKGTCRKSAVEKLEEQKPPNEPAKKRSLTRVVEKSTTASCRKTAGEKPQNKKEKMKATMSEKTTNRKSARDYFDEQKLVNKSEIKTVRTSTGETLDKQKPPDTPVTKRSLTKVMEKSGNTTYKKTVKQYLEKQKPPNETEKKMSLTKVVNKSGKMTTRTSAGENLDKQKPPDKPATKRSLTKVVEKPGTVTYKKTANKNPEKLKPPSKAEKKRSVINMVKKTYNTTAEKNLDKQKFPKELNSKQVDSKTSTTGLIPKTAPTTDNQQRSKGSILPFVTRLCQRIERQLRPASPSAGQRSTSLKSQLQTKLKGVEQMKTRPNPSQLAELKKILLERKEKQLEEEALRKLSQRTRKNKQTASKSKNPVVQILKNDIEESQESQDQEYAPTMKATTVAGNAKVANRPPTSTKKETVIATPPDDLPPPKFFGNTGYFILTGTNEQLTQQLNDLTAQNVCFQRCLLLPPGMTEKVEQQLQELNKNREQILQKMHDKYAMLAPRRVRREKKPYKYSKRI